LPAVWMQDIPVAEAVRMIVSNCPVDRTVMQSPRNRPPLTTAQVLALRDVHRHLHNQSFNGIRE
jgi:hypothetical protein